jgi:hypothetical protein
MGRSITLSFFVIFITVFFMRCGEQTQIPTQVEVQSTIRDDGQSFLKLGKSVTLNTLSYFTVDPFADAVVEDGVNDQGQGFPDPAGVLGIIQLFDPAKTPPVLGVGVNGYVVVDMGEGEEIYNGSGIDFMVIEADGSLLASGFGAPEPFTVSISNSSSGPFVNIGTANGSGYKMPVGFLHPERILEELLPSIFEGLTLN